MTWLLLALCISSSFSFEFTQRFSTEVTALDLTGNEARDYGGLALWEQQILATDASENNLRRISADGHLMGLINPAPPFQTPLGLGVSPERIAVVDGSSHRIRFFDVHGAELAQLGGKGTRGGEFYYPKDIVYSQNQKLWFVSDYGNRRIQAFFEDHSLAHQLLYKDPKTLQLASPRSLATKDQRLYAAYPASRRVVVHRLDGINQVETVFQDPALQRPVSIAVEHTGLVFIADEDGDIFVLKAEGQKLGQFSLPKHVGNEVQIRDMAFDSLGTLFVADGMQSRILRVPASRHHRLMQKAHTEFTELRFEEALNTLNTLLTEDESHLRAQKEALELYHLLATRAIEQESWDEALKCLNAILRIEPSNHLAVARLRVVRFHRSLPWMQDLLLGVSCLLLVFVLLYSLAFPRRGPDVPEELLDDREEKDPS